MQNDTENGVRDGTVAEIFRDQNHFFVDNFADTSNKKLKNVSFESSTYPTY